jgi:DNA polymerase-3 subunit epsilon
MKNLKLDRPIAFIDLETTGISLSADRIVELTVLKINPDSTEEFKSTRINPQIPIPTEATNIHGITDDDVADKPIFRQYARSLRDFMNDCDIGGFNVKKFDLPILEAEFRRAGVEFSRKGRCILDTMVIYHRLDPRNLAAAYRQYCGRQLENRHTSGGDVRAAAEILEGQLDMHPELPRDVDGLHEFCCDPDEESWIDAEGKFVWSEGEATFGFGKYRGKLLKEIAGIDAEYLQWVASADFSADARGIATNALNGEFPELPELTQPTEDYF